MGSPTKQQIDFILAVDSAEARKLRRAVAGKRLGLGLQVGTISELIHLFSERLLPPAENEDWVELLKIAATEAEDCFWGESIKVSVEDTVDVLSSALNRLFTALPVGQYQLPELGDVELPFRLRNHYHDLAALHQQMGGALPQSIEMMRRIVEGKPEDWPFQFSVYLSDGVDCTPHEQHFISVVSQGEQNLEIVELVQAVTTEPPQSSMGNALGELQQNLFEEEGAPSPQLDDSVQWVQCRDPQEEAEAAALLIQDLVDGGSIHKEIGVLIPHDAKYEGAVADAFSTAGIPLSGLDSDVLRRDVAAEAVRSFLHSRKSPMRRMALADLLSSPVMPWDTTVGNALAGHAIDGRVDEEQLRKRELFSDEVVEQVLFLLKQPATIQGLAEMMKEFAERIDAGPDLMARVQSSVDKVLQVLDQQEGEGEEIPWRDLLDSVLPTPLAPEQPADFTIEGVSIFYEGASLWRDVEHLYVLGFNEGHYPTVATGSPVFPVGSAELLNQSLGFSIKSSQQLQQEKRLQFRSQIRIPSSSCIFLSSYQGATGDQQTLSESMPFMAKAMGVKPDDLSKRICRIEVGEERKLIPAFSKTDRKEVEQFTPEVPEQLDFGKDLFTALRMNKEGERDPESPSSLEKLMISPLAWLLYRGGLQSRIWEVEDLGVAAKGTLAHAVFEKLFRKGSDIPTAEEIRATVPEFFRLACAEEASFINLEEWKLDRITLESEIVDAAVEWGRILREAGVTIVGVETALSGEMDGFPLGGRADLLAKTDDHLLVVDYKKSKSDKRRKRMEAGYDSQAWIYQQMLKTGAENLEDEIKSEIDSVQQIGAVYYTMNDRTALSAEEGGLDPAVEGVESVPGEIAVNAMAEIRTRISEVERGVVVLNREGDEKRFEKANVSPEYTLDESPLLRMFMGADDE